MPNKVKYEERTLSMVLSPSGNIVGDMQVLNDVLSQPKEETLGFVQIDYALYDYPENRFRVSSIYKTGNHVDQFINELQTFVNNIKVQNPIKLNFSLFVSHLINNKSVMTINDHIEVV